ncbi:hypothetical protein [Streptomyces sp. NPDC059909]|uniref:hypothetical protein n=1 Tax=Streptomyces sp. NPDC059909 TaxID=3346998 RepID=UPI003666AEBC
MIRPATVQMLTVRASCCHDRIRSSYGWAASGRKTIGFDSARLRRLDPFGPRFPARMFARNVV